MREAQFDQPRPEPLAPTTDDYGRPEPLTGGGDPTDAPLYIDPGTEDIVHRVELGAQDGEPTATVQGVSTPPDRGSLPGRWGNAYAPITMVVFNDFECPYCAKLEATFQMLHQRYPHQIELYFRDYPLDFHAHARGAHVAARCAHEQGRFWAMHDLLLANQQALTQEDLLRYAGELGLDTRSFEDCLVGEHPSAAVELDIAAAKAAGATGTPTTFVNGTLVRGAQLVDNFVKVIDEQL